MDVLPLKAHAASQPSARDGGVVVLVGAEAAASAAGDAVALSDVIEARAAEVAGTANVVDVADSAQPRWTCAQHHCFLLGDQALFQSKKVSTQLNSTISDGFST